MPSLAIVPAAGRGERFGSTKDGAQAKLLASVDGEPLLDRTLASLIDGGVDAIVVVIPPGSTFDAVRRLGDPRVRVVTNPDPSPGMFSSIQVGWQAAEGDPVLILPGDMPFVRPETVAAVIAACRDTAAVVSPRTDGRRGHPVGLPAGLRPVVLASARTSTLGDLLRAQTLARVEVEVADPGILRDVDVPGDLG
jgi:molybdenum cofactor cytidylyltransferase